MNVRQFHVAVSVLGFSLISGLAQPHGAFGQTAGAPAPWKRGNTVLAHAASPNGTPPQQTLPPAPPPVNAGMPPSCSGSIPGQTLPPPPVNAGPPPIAAEVAALIAQYPNGGPALAAAIENLLLVAPQLATDVALAAKSASPQQQRALADAFIAARNNLVKPGSDPELATIFERARLVGNSQFASLVGPLPPANGNPDVVTGAIGPNGQESQNAQVEPTVTAVLPPSGYIQASSGGGGSSSRN